MLAEDIFHRMMNLNAMTSQQDQNCDNGPDNISVSLNIFSENTRLNTHTLLK
jgi:hypothetical protein